MWMYSLVKSQVHMRAFPSPAVQIDDDGHVIFRAFFRGSTISSKGYSRPPRQTSMPASQISTRSESNLTPERPAAARMRPQLGSAPAKAVFTSGELAMVRATWSAALVRRRAAHFDFDHALRAFAIGDDRQRQRFADARASASTNFL